MLLWFITLYPIRKTFQTLDIIAQKKSEDVGESVIQWTVFWLYFSLSLQYQSVLEYIPFWWIINLAILGLAQSNTQFCEMAYTLTVNSVRSFEGFLNRTINFGDRIDEFKMNYLNFFLEGGGFFRSPFQVVNKSS